MSAAPPPEVDEHERTRRDRVGRVFLWIGLAAGIAAITVTVPPLVDRAARDGGAGHSSATPSPAGTSSQTSQPTGVVPPATGATSPAPLAAVVLRPVALATDTGSIGGGQSVLSLGVQDLSGHADDWNRYVEFSRSYRGHLTYRLPSGVAPASVTGIKVWMNYRGPAASTQSWRFQLHDWRTGSWVTVGSNGRVAEWGPWATLVFTAPGKAPDYVSPSHGIELQLVGGSSDDTADIDYLATVLTHR